ncbi:hypothetical protein [Streptomyces sp. 3214.6]|uniref:hypothetical protein n=1 Tax=Streptomyces sp. 3214.6 TaxID=1882757 RepID=UPI000909D66D|nr:hypothetical protein [Streptomyces sp. 3214.6]SHI32535.1 hypothetical protein SAMN05444521_7178 [Streptomyces sp. 3214.6]
MKFRSVAAACSIAISVTALPLVAATSASAAAAANCVTATYYLNDNAVDIHNGCSTTKHYKVAERFWPDSDCFAIKPGKTKHYEATGTIQGIKEC